MAAQNPRRWPVSYPSIVLDPVTRGALSAAPRLMHSLLAALVFAAAAMFVPDPVAAVILLAVAATLAVLAAMLRLLVGLHRRRERMVGDHIAAFIAEDASPAFTTDAEGRVDQQNRAARERFGTHDGHSLVRALGDLFASPASVLHRLQTRAAALGTAREDVVTRRGHVRLTVHRIAGGRFVWRLDEIQTRAPGGRGADAITLPMLVASGSGTVLFMNEAARRLVGGRVRTLDRIFPELPLRPGREAIVSALDGPVRAIVAEIAGSAGRREIYLLPAAETPQAAVEVPDSDATIEAVPVALAQLSADGRIVAANRLARELLASPDAPGRLLSELLDGLGRPIGEWLDEALAGRATRPEVLTAPLAGRERFLQVSLRPARVAGRTGLVAVLNDATELKSLEAQVAQSQKMQAIGQLAGGVAHDFNNLLTAISGHCDLLLLRHGPGDPDHADLAQIHQNANRAAGLVSQLLAFSRKQMREPKVIDLREVLADLGHLLNRLVGEKINLTVSHAPDLGAIRADPRQIEQVVMNLVVNARDAMPEGGAIRIETENLDLDSDLRHGRATIGAGAYVVVRVSDTGGGIPADLRDKIFEPFYTTKRPGEGTGLGLSTVYGIVKQSGGFIFSGGAPGAGATFTLYFPRAAEAAAEAGLPAPPPRKALPRDGDGHPPRGGVVLLVEDEAPVRAFAARALQLRGFTVIEADSAEQALEKLADPDLAVDVFVTDVVMPGMDGPSWVREALRDRPRTRVIFVSGYAEDSVAEARARIPNSVFLPKPFSLGELTRTVQEQLH